MNLIKFIEFKRLKHTDTSITEASSNQQKAAQNAERDGVCSVKFEGK